MKLYEMGRDYAAVLSVLEESDRFEDLVDTLDSIDENIKQKVENIGDMIVSFNAEASALKAEAKRLNERATKAEKEAASLLGYIDHVMNENKFDELKGLRHTFKFSESISLRCHDVSMVPRHFQKPQPPTADIAGMKADFKKRYEDKGIKLVNKKSAKPKTKELLYEELNEHIRDMGLEFVRNKKLNMK